MSVSNHLKYRIDDSLTIREQNDNVAKIFFDFVNVQILPKSSFFCIELSTMDSSTKIKNTFTFYNDLYYGLFIKPHFLMDFQQSVSFKPSRIGKNETGIN